MNEKTNYENTSDMTEKPAFQTLAINIPGIVYRVHLREENHMEFFNDMLEEMTGYKISDLKTGDVCSIDPMIVHEDRIHILEDVNAALIENKPFEVEYRIIHKGGDIRYFLERGKPVYGDDGKPRFVDGVIIDITKRKQAEDALVFKDNIILCSSSIIATCDLNGMMTYGNPSFLEAWGFDNPEEFIGRPFWEFWLVEDMFMDIMQQLRSNGTWLGEIMAKKKDGSIFDVRVSAAMVFDNQGKPVALTSTSIDITDRKLAEKALRKARDELEFRVEERTAELELKNRELQDFVFIASHDMAEPLRKIKTFGKMLINNNSGNFVDDTSRDYLRRMQTATERMQNLLCSLLSYSRVTTRAEPFKNTDLNISLKEALSNLEIVIKAKNAEVELCDLPTVEADGIQMIQLFQNLIGNALKFVQEGKTPYIKIFSREKTYATGSYEICVEDNGIGFDEKYMDQIFIPFKRLSGRESGFGGEGMGLSICKKIVERHGGGISAKSELGKGSSFFVTLPAKK